MAAVRVFVSYSHDSDPHKAWVLKLATDRRHRRLARYMLSRLCEETTAWHHLQPDRALLPIVRTWRWRRRDSSGTRPIARRWCSMQDDPRATAQDLIRVVRRRPVPRVRPALARVAARSGHATSSPRTHAETT